MLSYALYEKVGIMQGNKVNKTGDLYIQLAKKELEEKSITDEIIMYAYIKRFGRIKPEKT